MSSLRSIFKREQPSCIIKNKIGGEPNSLDNLPVAFVLIFDVSSYVVFVVFKTYIVLSCLVLSFLVLSCLV